jgi:CRISPR-associated endonuclease Csy4
MDHYQEIRLLPDPEFPATVLLNALYARLHLALVQEGSGRIGISFPAHDPSAPNLGHRLRLHAEAERLRAFTDGNWLKGLSDHALVGEPQPIPPHAQHRIVRRVQAKSSPERLRRRAMHRHGISETAARKAIPDKAAERLDLPYLTLDSRSTGQRFRLFIDHGPLMERPTDGTFSQYGLSSTASVPWF